MANTTFNPSTFNKQAAASLDMMDVEVAQERVQAILGKQAGPTLTPQPQTQPQAPAFKEYRFEGRVDTGTEGILGPPSPAPRKKRSDAGIPKKPPADADEIVLRLTLAEARNAAIACGKFDCHGIADNIQDQIIAQLQKKLDLLTKQK